MALTIRRTEERLLKLFSQGRIFGTVHTCIGQEFVGIAVARALRKGDFLVSNHRGHGHYLAWTDDVEGLIAEVMGRQTGTCAGRGGSQHLCKDGFISNGIQGGMAPVSAGLAFARKLRGTQEMGVLYVGDGTLGEGALYEALNIVSKWSLPVLIVLENNRYAQSTSQEETLAGDICARAKAFGIESTHADTWEWQRLFDETERCVESVRRTGRPHFLQVDTYRLAPHSKSDDNRDPAEIKAHSDRDPLNMMLASEPDAWRETLDAIEQRLDRAIAAAEAAPTQAPAIAVADTPAKPQWSPLDFAEERVVKAIRLAFAEAMQKDPSIVFIGEDIRSPYGGAFKATQGLSDDHSNRVVNTPISEASIVGVGSGLALGGMKPVAEIMFGDFVLLAADQFVNHAAKFRWMYNDQVEVPLVVRTPMGGKRGYGPTHSQSLEKHLLGVPGTQVLALHARYSPLDLYRTLLTSIDCPTLVLENKLLYGQVASPKVANGWILERTEHAFPTVRLRPAGIPADVTLVTYGGMLEDVEKAIATLFTEHELACELLVPLRLYPFDLAPIEESVARTKRVVVVEEGQGFLGFGAEVLAQLSEHIRGGFVARRLAAASHPIPASRPLEQTALPSPDSIVRAVLEAARG